MNEESNRSGKTGMIILIIVVVLLALGGAWYWGFYKPEQVAKEKARLEQVAKEEAEQKRKDQAAQKKKQYDQLIADADASFGQGNWQTAKTQYQQASQLFPGEAYPKDQLVLVNEQLEIIAAREAQIAAGVVESVTERTGRFYIIVSSSIDKDLASDYATKLAKDGNAVQIIEHDDTDHFYYRVALGDYPTRAEGEAELSSFSDYGQGVWVLKY